MKNAVLLVHGEKAHSYYFSQTAFAQLKEDNKKFISIPDAVHIDLYDQVDIIPFDDIEEIIRENI